MFKNKSVELVDSLNKNLWDKRKKLIKKYNRRITFFMFLIPCLVFCFCKNILISLIVSALWIVLFTIFFDHRDITDPSPIIRVWFGVPGSGKTSVAAWLTRSSCKNNFKVLSNVPLKGSYKLDEEDLGNVDMSFDGAGCHVIYDEATINGLDNRGFKQFSLTNKPKYFSIHRHMDNRVDVFSQSYDVDLKIKDRAGERGLFHLRRFPLKGFVMYRMIKKVLFIRKEDKQFIDGFEYCGLPRICFTRSVWDSFDTKDKSLCPTNQKQWELWEFEN